MDGRCGFENVSFYLSLHPNCVSGILVSCFILISRWVDSLGNVHGRVEGRNASAEALLMGSHLVMFFPHISKLNLDFEKHNIKHDDKECSVLGCQ